MTLLENCRDLLRYSAASKPLLLIPKSLLDEFLDQAYELSPTRKQLDRVPWRCIPQGAGPCVIDLAD